MLVKAQCEPYFATYCRAPLHYASANIHHSCVMTIVAAGSQIDVLDSNGCTPLHFAASFDIEAKYGLSNYYKIAFLLLKLYSPYSL